MNEVFIPWPLLTAFLVASFVLAVTPGPGVLYIVTRSVAQGRRSGLASVVGVALGNLGNAVGASFGLAALFAVSATAFIVVKYAGALYLIYLGVKALRRRPEESEPAIKVQARLAKILRDGFLIALLNPKTAMFFAAFLPQFMAGESTSMMHSLVLGVMFVGMAAVTDTAYAIAAGTLSATLARARGADAVSRYLRGGAFIGLGLFTAISGSRSTK